LSHERQQTPSIGFAPKGFGLAVIFTATADGVLDLGERKVRCALGPAGVVPAAAKREGDGGSPAGVWPIRKVIYRPDRGPPPASEFRVCAMTEHDGWCDDPADPAYNRPVKRPYPASSEALWRDDGVYDIIVVLGHNDDPVVPGMGSAIFLHLCRPGYPPTEGCVAIARDDLEDLLSVAKPGDAVEIRA
jgi:L,D-peptidoglycan transpeptidase YkuD (ErfK/YbiS/YcfS/YnhG family)